MAVVAARREPGNAAFAPLGRIAVGLLAIALAIAAPACEAKRSAPAAVPPVVVDGMRYEVPRMGTPFGSPQECGTVVARRAGSGEVVWTRRVYTVVRDPHLEGDVQDVFIKALTLAPDGKHLEVLNERGKRFELDLEGKGVRAIP